MRLFSCQYGSPLGPITAIASLNGLCFLIFQEDQDTGFLEGPLSKISQYYQCDNLKVTMDASQPILQQTLGWLESYFERPGAKLPPVPAFDLEGAGSAFAIQVWRALLSVPYAKLESYGWVASQIQNPKAVRAVGRAIGDNPIALIIPCHRIIGANGSLTGFRSGLWRKTWLLKHEGHNI